MKRNVALILIISPDSNKTVEHFSFSLSEIPDIELPEELKKTVCLRAGSTLRLNATILGRPLPVVSWRKPGIDLQSRGYIETSERSTTLIVEKVHRYDAGKYTIEAENPSGKKAITLFVKIYGMDLCILVLQ